MAVGRVGATVIAKDNINVCWYNKRGPSCLIPPCCQIPSNPWCDGDEMVITYTYSSSTGGNYVAWRLDDTILYKRPGQASPVSYQIDWRNYDPKDSDPYIFRFEIWDGDPDVPGSKQLNACEGKIYIYTRPVVNIIEGT